VKPETTDVQYFYANSKNWIFKDYACSFHSTSVHPPPPKIDWGLTALSAQTGYIMPLKSTLPFKK